ncbi:RidA family protein [Brucella pseudogrignonensis]
MIERHHSNARMSQMVTYPLSGTGIVLSGLVAEDLTLDVKGQTAEILTKIDQLLAEAGGDKSQVTHIYIWLPDISDFDAMNSVYDAWVADGHQPARACVEAKLANPRIRVEIQAFAVKL